MTKSDLEGFRAQTAALKERIRALLREPPSSDSDDFLSDEVVTRELVAQYGSREAADTAIRAIVESMVRREVAANDGDSPAVMSRGSGQQGLRSRPETSERFTDLAAYSEPRRSRMGRVPKVLDGPAPDFLGDLRCGSKSAILIRRGTKVVLQIGDASDAPSKLFLAERTFDLIAGTDFGGSGFEVLELTPKVARQFLISHQEDGESFPAWWG